MPEKNILITVFTVIKGKLLVNGADTHLKCLRNGKAGIFPSLHRDGAAIRRKITGEQLDEGGLSGAVIPYDCRNHSPLDRERNIGQSSNGAK